MPRRRRTIPTVSGEGPDPNVELSEQNWRKIEHALGAEISREVRTQLIDSTTRFLFWANYEKIGDPVSKTKTRISTVAKKAKELLQLQAAIGNTNANLYAQMLIDRHLLGITKVDRYRHLTDIMIFIVEACKKAIEELSSEQVVFQSGQGWERWIEELTGILKNDGLPTKVRRDCDKAAKLSPFVHFVKELQRHAVPAAIQPKHSPFGLAEAIIRARRVTIGRLPTAQKTRKAKA
jgi:hypothetical protein